MTQTPDDHALATRKRLSIFNPSTPLWLFPLLAVILCALIIWIPTHSR